MSLILVFNRLRQQCGADLPWLIVFALLIPGCAGKRIDLLTSQVDEESSETNEANGTPQRTPAPADSSTNDRPRIATGDDAGSTSLLSALSPRRVWGRITGSENVVTTDPFVEGGEAVDPEPSSSGQLVKSDVSSVDDLLAKFTRSIPDEDRSSATPWWEQDAAPVRASEPTNQVSQHQFADEFDSRLDRLRSELAAGPDASTHDGSRFVNNTEQANPFVSEDTNPFASQHAEPFADDDVNPFASSDSMVIAESEAATAQDAKAVATAFSGVDPPKPDLFPLPRIEARVPRIEARETTKDRVLAMVASARSEWEHQNPRRAYRTALDAQEIALFENMEFAPDELHPQDLAEQIAMGMRQGSSPQALPGDALPKVVERRSAEAEPILAPLGFPEFGPFAGSWDSLGGGASRISAEPQAGSARTTGGSGVSLLPPDDDFPSAAEMPEWNTDANPFAGSLSDSGGEPPDAIQLTIHEGSDPAISSDEQPSDQLPGLTDEDNQELLSTVSEQRSRVFESTKLEWPSLPSLSESEGTTESGRRPLRVAQAPRFALESESEAATTSTVDAAPSAGSGSVLGQIWRSQPIWFVGGLVLLVIALRLLPWPRDDSTERM